MTTTSSEQEYEEQLVSTLPETIGRMIKSLEDLGIYKRVRVPVKKTNVRYVNGVAIDLEEMTLAYDGHTIRAQNRSKPTLIWKIILRCILDEPYPIGMASTSDFSNKTFDDLKTCVGKFNSRWKKESGKNYNLFRTTGGDLVLLKPQKGKG